MSVMTLSVSQLGAERRNYRTSPTFVGFAVNCKRPYCQPELYFCWLRTVVRDKEHKERRSPQDYHTREQLHAQVQQEIRSFDTTLGF